VQGCAANAAPRASDENSFCHRFISFCTRKTRI
jgi:hypothetical protein